MPRWASSRKDCPQGRDQKDWNLFHGPLPEVDHNSEHGFDHDSESVFDLTDEALEEGDHILATGLLPPPSMDIWASSTILQRLAEAFHTNEEALTLLPDYLQEFTSIFSKQSFNALLEPKEWDLSEDTM